MGDPPRQQGAEDGDQAVGGGLAVGEFVYQGIDAALADLKRHGLRADDLAVANQQHPDIVASGRHVGGEVHPGLEQRLALDADRAGLAGEQPGRLFDTKQGGAERSGFGGIGYNREKVGRELKTIDDLWADDLKGRIVVLSEYRDTAGLVMQSQGVDIDGDWGSTEFENALDLIEQKIEEGYIRKVKGNSYMEDLTSGNAVAGITLVAALPTSIEVISRLVSWKFPVPPSKGGSSKAAASVTTPRTGLSARCG